MQIVQAAQISALQITPASVVPPIPALEQRQFVTAMHAADVKRQMEVPVMEAQKETVQDRQINVKVMVAVKVR